jgi:hypothetical protein
MFPSLLSVLSCLSSKALERLASLASLAYSNARMCYLVCLSFYQLSLWCDVACGHGSLIEDYVCVCLLVYGKWGKCPQRRAHSSVLQSYQCMVIGYSYIYGVLLSWRFVLYMCSISVLRLAEVWSSLQGAYIDTRLHSRRASEQVRSI